MRKELERKLHYQRYLGRHILGLSTATGMNAHSAIESGVDLILILNSGKFRQMGRSSLGGYLPFNNSNEEIMDIAKSEILPISDKASTILGINGTDPLIDERKIFDFIDQYKISGVVNYPTVALIDGQFREALNESGVTFQQEISFLRHAHEKNVFTIAFVTNPQEAILANQIPVDMICIHLGLTSGGLSGAKRIKSLEDMVNIIKGICKTLKDLNSTSLITIYGGIMNNLNEVRYVYNQFKDIDGFIGGSAFERIVPERIIGEQTKAFKNSSQTDNNSLTQKMIDEDNKSYSPVKFVQSFIKENYSSKIQIKDLAELLHLSSPYLSKLFKEQTSMSFTEYLIRFRLNKAIELMGTTNQSLTTIASVAGYPDYPQFRKLFKKYIGKSPSEYQKMIKTK